MNFKEVPNGTEIHYWADISLRHFFKLFTPLIKGDLETMAKQAEEGIKRKIE